MTTIEERATLEAVGPGYRFTLRSLFVGMTLAGVFLAISSLENLTWVDALRSIVTLLLVAGLAQQVVDLAKIHRENFRADRPLQWKRLRPENTPDVFPAPTGRLVWEIAWRCLLAALLLVFAGEMILKRLFPALIESVQFEIPDGALPSIGWQLVLLMLLLTSQRAPRRGNSVVGKCLSAVLLLAVIGLGFFVVHSWTLIDYLVFTALRNVEKAQPAIWNGKPFYHFDPRVDLQQTLIQGSWYALGGLIVTLLAAWFALNSKRVAWRATLSAIALVGLVSLMGANLWAQKLLFELDPFRHVNPDLLLRPYFILNIFAIAAIYSAGAVRVVLRDLWPKNPDSPQLAWRKEFGSYVPERIPCLVVIGIAAAEPAVQSLAEYVQFLTGPWRGRGLASSIADVLCQPTVLLSLLASFVVIQCLLRSRASAAKRQQEPLAWQPVPWLSASLLWLAIMASLLTITATFYWLSWAQWLS